MIGDKLKLLHALGIQARELTGSPTNEPRTVYRILPDGTGVVSFYSTCFSFVDGNLKNITFSADRIDEFINKAADEIKQLKNISGYTHKAAPVFKEKPYIIPVMIFTKTCKRVYKVHLCKEHRKSNLKYNPHCTCYVTWEDIG